MTEQVAEIVRFKLREGADEAAFVDSAKGTVDFVAEQKGFVRRSLSKSDDGVWVDYVEWRSLDDALAAAKRVEAEPSFEPFLTDIDLASIEMRHQTIKMYTD
ncbi:MAG: hypothetical protein AAFR65_02490 [Pseudomonadota bacterium]